MRDLDPKWRTLGAVLALAAAIALLVAGAAGVKWYVWDIAIAEAGEPDRSMLFWGIPVLFIGGGALVAGALLTRVALRSIRG
jgi:succinate dehydrogenase/fumarate reductase cytochrome b subunit